VVTDPETLVCECGHQKATHALFGRHCLGEVFTDNMKKLEPCTCPRFKFWYDDDDDSLTPSEQALMDGCCLDEDLS